MSKGQTKKDNPEKLAIGYKRPENQSSVVKKTNLE
jgi:hypothetical protein